MITRNTLARAIATLFIPLCLAACVADTTEPSELDTVEVAEDTLVVAAGELSETVAVAAGDDANATTETNGAGCLSYVGVVTIKEYECPCWTTYYYDRFYNFCTGTYVDSFLFEKASCSYKYGTYCP